MDPGVQSRCNSLFEFNLIFSSVVSHVIVDRATLTDFAKTPLLSRGGVAARIKKKLRSHLSPRRRGGVGQQPNIFLTNTTPSAPSKEASLSTVFHKYGHVYEEPQRHEDTKKAGINDRWCRLSLCLRVFVVP